MILKAWGPMRGPPPGRRSAGQLNEIPVSWRAREMGLHPQDGEHAQPDHVCPVPKPSGVRLNGGRDHSLRTEEVAFQRDETPGRKVFGPHVQLFTGKCTNGWAIRGHDTDAVEFNGLAGPARELAKK